MIDVRGTSAKRPGLRIPAMIGEGYLAGSFFGDVGVMVCLVLVSLARME